MEVLLIFNESSRRLVSTDRMVSRPWQWL